MTVYPTLTQDIFQKFNIQHGGIGIFLCKEGQKVISIE